MGKTILALALAALAAAEPEADADPYYYGGYGLGYGHGLYGGYRTYGLGYSRGWYGKREAEAEPKADADPYYYGGYGYGGYRTYGLGYGYGLRRACCLYRRPRCPHPCRLQLRPGLPLCLPLHRRHCPRCHPRRWRSLRWCRTLRRQLCWNRPCCQEGG